MKDFAVRVYRVSGSADLIVRAKSRAAAEAQAIAELTTPAEIRIHFACGPVGFLAMKPVTGTVRTIDELNRRTYGHQRA